ncbi:hypothetical protein R6Q57_020501, partial [Mikania cordata]
AAQLLIYVGAINVLIIFAVMFINGSEYSKDFHLWTVGDGVTSVVCTSLFVSLITTIPDTSWYGERSPFYMKDEDLALKPP